MNRIDPKIFNLNSCVVIEKRKDSFKLVVNRKSRIIMKDGKIVGTSKSDKKNFKKTRYNFYNRARL